MGNYQETDVNPMEIERQFLITDLPPLPPAYDLLRQGYVALLPEIRIRQIGDSHFTLTVKRGASVPPR